MGVTLAADSVRKILNFLTENLFRYSSAYSFVFEAYPDEVDHLVELEICTPVVTTLPLQLASADAFMHSL